MHLLSAQLPVVLMVLSIISLTMAKAILTERKQCLRRKGDRALSFVQQSA